MRIADEFDLPVARRRRTRLVRLEQRETVKFIRPGLTLGEHFDSNRMRSGLEAVDEIGTACRLLERANELSVDERIQDDVAGARFEVHAASAELASKYSPGH
jgi:hypothetical protein